MSRLRRRGDGEEGFALVFVLLLTTALMALVATTLTVTTPNIVNARNDQDASAALLAAQSGVEDVIAYLSSTAACRSTTKVCAEALGASSVALDRTQPGNGETFTWTTDPTLTPEQYVRVRVTGRTGRVTKNLVADISLAPSILSFGYYTDYESQSPDYLKTAFGARVIDLTDSTVYAKVNARNTNSQTVTISSPTTVAWNGPPPDNSTSTNPYPAGVCGQHWYYDSASSPGRSTNGSNAVWGETGTVVTSRSNTMIRTAGCDVVFTSGMEMDGPIYTRDALYISDGTSGGVGPIFDAPVYSLWGFGKYNNPAPAATTPWRKDTQVGGNISAQSPYKPQVAGLDLQLPTDIGLVGMPANNCVYFGPTRVILNGDGTATVTSPGTTTRNSASDTGCYPSTLDSRGVVNFRLNYKSVGTGTIFVKKLGSPPTAGWPDNTTKAGNTPTAANEVFYLPSTTGGTSVPDSDTITAPTAQCSTSVHYSATPGAPCAWTDVSGTSESGGWTSYTSSGKCNAAFAATDQRNFECEYTPSTSAVAPTKTYATLRSTVQAALAGGQCNSVAGSAVASCLSTYFGGLLQPANSGARAVNATGATTGDHQYVVTVTGGSPVTGSAQSIGSAPTPPVAADSFFDTTSSPAQETPTRTPYTVSVGRQTYACYGKTTPFAVDSTGNSCTGAKTCILFVCTATPITGQFGWGDGSNGARNIAQFVTTVTKASWTISRAASAASYFPDVNDVSSYNAGTDQYGAVAGAGGTNQPGDLYVQGANSGKLSLIADNDVVLTGDITNPKDTSYADVYNPASDAVDIVAGRNVRNYNPVQCDDQNPSDIAATSAGWCPNDITGLYNSILESNGVLNAAHPAMQYTNMVPAGARRIDAAVFALSGSFMTDNYSRGVALGKLTVNGGIYQSHRGANGIQWEYTGSGARPSSGYSLQYHYIDLERANLPYAPPATGGASTRVWNVVSESAG